MNLVKLLFFLHILIILFGLSMGFFLPFYVVLGIVSLHRLQFFVFGDCLLSIWQRKIHGLSKKEHFFQQVSKELFNKKINEKESKAIDATIISLVIIIALVKNFFLNN